MTFFNFDLKSLVGNFGLMSVEIVCASIIGLSLLSFNHPPVFQKYLQIHRLHHQLLIPLDQGY